MVICDDSNLGGTSKCHSLSNGILSEGRESMLRTTIVACLSGVIGISLAMLAPAMSGIQCLNCRVQVMIINQQRGDRYW
jgi:hypothetical protein